MSVAFPDGELEPVHLEMLNVQSTWGGHLLTSHKQTTTSSRTSVVKGWRIIHEARNSQGKNGRRTARSGFC